MLLISKLLLMRQQPVGANKQNRCVAPFLFILICGKTQKENPGNDMFPGFVVDNNYLFENCGARRAAFKPYSFKLKVRKPLKTLAFREVALKFHPIFIPYNSFGMSVCILIS